MGFSTDVLLLDISVFGAGDKLRAGRGKLASVRGVIFVRCGSPSRERGRVSIPQVLSELPYSLFCVLLRGHSSIWLR